MGKELKADQAFIQKVEHTTMAGNNSLIFGFYEDSEYKVATIVDLAFGNH